MMIVRGIVMAVTLILYGFLFSLQEQKAQDLDESLGIALPVNFYNITAGYTWQLAAEMLFIKTSVFLGGLQPGIPPESYADALDNNFQVMTSLYPRFIDPYYVCQAFLPHISVESAAQAGAIFETGIAAHPDNFILRFFHGANFFLAMNEPLKGAKVFAEAAKIPNSPLLFSHLAAVLSAKGGDIAAGLISLKTMLASEKDETVRARYEEEIAIFEQAMAVQVALNSYQKKYGTYPGVLGYLVPEFLPKIPEIKGTFELFYDRPTLRLQRPARLRRDGTPVK